MDTKRDGMITLHIVNDRTGTNTSANYKYVVMVNGKTIDEGRVKGHNRADDWRKLVKLIAMAGDGVPPEAFEASAEASPAAFW